MIPKRAQIFPLPPPALCMRGSLVGDGGYGARDGPHLYVPPKHHLGPHVVHVGHLGACRCGAGGKGAWSRGWAVGGRGERVREIDKKKTKLLQPLLAA